MKLNMRIDIPNKIKTSLHTPMHQIIRYTILFVSNAPVGGMKLSGLHTLSPNWILRAQPMLGCPYFSAVPPSRLPARAGSSDPVRGEGGAINIMFVDLGDTTFQA